VRLGRARNYSAMSRASVVGPRFCWSKQARRRQRQPFRLARAGRSVASKQRDQLGGIRSKKPSGAADKTATIRIFRTNLDRNH
jgi:hypothetical protein